MKKSLKNKKLRSELGNVGIKKIIDNYSWIKMAKDRVLDYKIFVKDASKISNFK